jgi:hypothetical protein
MTELEPDEARRWRLAGLALFSIVGGLALVMNPGYFSHDELELLRAAQDPQWDSVFAPGAHDFYRPLSLAAKILLLRVAGGVPPLVHLASVLVHGANGALLYRLLRRNELGRAHASAAWILLSVSPLAAFATGWVAALDDLLATSFALLALIAATPAPGKTGTPAPFARTGAVGLATLAALLCKETPIVLPVLLLGLAWWRGYGEGRWHAAAIAAVVVGFYLALQGPRLEATAARITGPSGYGFAFDAHILRHLGSYLLFPFAVTVREVQSLSGEASAGLLIVAGLVHAAVVAGLYAARPRWALAYIACYVLVLAPVLPLRKIETQYLYPAALPLAIGLAALVTGAGRRWLRAVGVLAALLGALHAVRVGAYMRWCGEIQDRVLGALDACAGPPPGAIVIAIEPGSPDWVLRRAVHDRPEVTLLDPGATPPADAVRLRFTTDGALVKQ